MKPKRILLFSILGIIFVLIAAILWVLNQQLFTWGLDPATAFNYTPLPTFSLPTLPAGEPDLDPATPTPTVAPAAVDIATPAAVSQLPDPAQVEWRLFAAGFDRPIDIVHAGDGSGRLFVVEQSGVIWILAPDGTRSEQPFLDLQDRVGATGNEQGLLGLAFYPDYAVNGYFVVHYSDLRGDTVIARFRVSADSDLADPATERHLLNVRQPYANHNGGTVAFGPDGYLYVGLGDGGLAADPEGNGQSVDTYLGKILRIAVSTVPEGEIISVPVDNPFIGGDAPLIWAYGLRNPWRFSFDALTGDLYIGDVGQNIYEEINFLPFGTAGGANFGWDYYEGLHIFEGQAPADGVFVLPIAEYEHTLGCSVTGGMVYRGERLPDWQGVYLYGDYCTGNIWGLLQKENGSWRNALLFESLLNIASFGVDEANELYLADLGGDIYILTEK